ncbi:MAG: hypothetical protein AAF290_08110 [Pseudomonadota bacterium]
MRAFAEAMADAHSAAGIARFLKQHRLHVTQHPQRVAIPQSYWGDSEAGIEGETIHVRGDTPLHSFLHEACHAICAAAAARGAILRDAGGCDLEEAAVCYLQLCVADRIDPRGWRGLADDMDAWGYSFPDGSTAQWFSNNADDARRWLGQHGLGEWLLGGERSE